MCLNTKWLKTADTEMPILLNDVVICVVQMTSEWREIDFADADISLLGVTKITDVSHFLCSTQCFPSPLPYRIGRKMPS